MGIWSRLGEIVRAIAAARFPPPPKRRYDITGDAISQAFGGKGGGRERIREGGVEDEAAAEMSDLHHSDVEVAPRPEERR